MRKWVVWRLSGRTVGQSPALVIDLVKSPVKVDGWALGCHVPHMSHALSNLHMSILLWGWRVQSQTHSLDHCRRCPLGLEQQQVSGDNDCSVDHLRESSTDSSPGGHSLTFTGEQSVVQHTLREPRGGPLEGGEVSEWVEFNAPLDTIQVISEAEAVRWAVGLQRLREAHTATFPPLVIIPPMKHAKMHNTNEY